LSRQCSGITREGGRCARSVDGPNGLCWLHDPTRSEDRRRAASKAGRSKPSREVVSVKQRLSDLANDVLAGRVERGDGAVVSQILNVYLRAIATEMKVREVEEIEGRLEELETALERRREGGSRWGT
jgi:hypothetical protein